MRGAVFGDLIARLPDGLECSTPDLPGHGERVGDPPSLDAAAECVAGIISGEQRVLLVGWSMGASVAWRYVERFGDARLAGLMSVDMSPNPTNSEDWDQGLIGQSAADVALTTVRMQRDWPGTAEAIATTMFANRGGAPGFSREDALKQILTNDPATMISLWKDLVTSDFRAVIPQLSCPLLATCGARSKVYPANAAEWLARTAPSGEMHVFEHSGHSPHLEEPDAFADCLMRFCALL